MIKAKEQYSDIHNIPSILDCNNVKEFSNFIENNIKYITVDGVVTYDNIEDSIDLCNMLLTLSMCFKTNKNLTKTTRYNYITKLIDKLEHNISSCSVIPYSIDIDSISSNYIIIYAIFEGDFIERLIQDWIIDLNEKMKWIPIQNNLCPFFDRKCEPNCMAFGERLVDDGTTSEIYCKRLEVESK